MIDVTDFVNMLNLQATNIDGKRVIDLKSVLYNVLEYNMIDTYDLLTSADIINNEIYNRCDEAWRNAQKIKDYAYGAKQYCAGKLYNWQEETDEYSNLQAENIQKVIDIADSMIYR